MVKVRGTYASLRVLLRIVGSQVRRDKMKYHRDAHTTVQASAEFPTELSRMESVRRANPACCPSLYLPFEVANDNHSRRRVR